MKLSNGLLVPEFRWRWFAVCLPLAGLETVFLLGMTGLIGPVQLGPLGEVPLFGIPFAVLPLIFFGILIQSHSTLKTAARSSKADAITLLSNSLVTDARQTADGARVARTTGPSWLAFYPDRIELWTPGATSATSVLVANMLKSARRRNFSGLTSLATAVLEVESVEGQSWQLSPIHGNVRDFWGYSKADVKHLLDRFERLRRP